MGTCMRLAVLVRSDVFTHFNLELDLLAQFDEMALVPLYCFNNFLFFFSERKVKR